MSSILQLYKKNRNGIIFTLLFHILIFLILNISQFKIKQEFKEVEMLIEFPKEILEKEKIENNNSSEVKESNTQNTNIASNRAQNNIDEVFDDDYQEELEKAQELVKDVSSQLSKEIPTINDLKMPEEKTEGMDPDSIMNKLYTGDSNVEYFLENRFHTVLPIPVYLSQKGGTVTVNIEVNNNGDVIKANPVIQTSVSEIILSYAKTAALRTKFNPINSKQKTQKGYIKYTFIAQ